MKQVFRIVSGEKGPTLGPIRPGTSQGIAENYLRFEGEPKAKLWKSVECYFATGRKLKTAFANFMFDPVVFKVAIDKDPVLRKLLLNSCELLPVVAEEREAYVVHSTNIVDCVDKLSSRIKYLDDDLWLFFPEKLRFGKIIKIATQPWVTIIASDSNLPPEEDFYQWYHKQGYKGLRFKLLWQSEE